ncbi:MAG: Rieske 2Fe-2S domain-containing protein [Dehalococcoidales bacterium]|nr:Rieske 2Fe-2S domain-containing protein [Dehalococcoidales bacterium]
MAVFVEVNGITSLEAGKMKEVMVEDHPVLLARVGDKYYAAQGRCAHMGGVLANGELNGTVVQCPRHGSQFDLKDGSVVRWMHGSGLAYEVGKTFKSPRPIAVYEVKVEKDKILVKLP